MLIKDKNVCYLKYRSPAQQSEEKNEKQSDHEARKTNTISIGAWAILGDWRFAFNATAVDVSLQTQLIIQFFQLNSIEA